MLRRFSLLATAVLAAACSHASSAPSPRYPTYPAHYPPPQQRPPSALSAPPPHSPPSPAHSPPPQQRPPSALSAPAGASTWLDALGVLQSALPCPPPGLPPSLAGSFDCAAMRSISNAVSYVPRAVVSS